MLSFSALAMSFSTVVRVFLMKSLDLPSRATYCTYINTQWSGYALLLKVYPWLEAMLATDFPF